MNDDSDSPRRSPWRVPALWLVIGGPALVVIASFVTLALAWHDADRPVREAVEKKPEDAGPPQ